MMVPSLKPRHWLASNPFDSNQPTGCCTRIESIYPNEADQRAAAQLPTGRATARPMIDSALRRLACRCTKWSRSRRIAAKARCHTRQAESEQGNSVGLQDDRRTRQRDGEDRKKEFVDH